MMPGAKTVYNFFRLFWCRICTLRAIKVQYFYTITFAMKKSVQRFYNQAGVDFSITRRKPLWESVKIQAKKVKEGQVVLDVGCGDGRLLRVLPIGVRYVGVDFSNTLLSIARTEFPEKEFIQGDITRASAWKTIRPAEAIFCIAVLHHVPTRAEQLSVLRHMRTRMTAEGWGYITVWNCWQPTYFLRHHVRSWRLKLQNWRWLTVPFKAEQPRFVFAFDVHYLQRLLREAGFAIDTVEYIRQDGSPANWRTGANIRALVKPAIK